MQDTDNVNESSYGGRRLGNCSPATSSLFAAEEANQEREFIGKPCCLSTEPKRKPLHPSARA
jgi:hypothetical protein